MMDINPPLSRKSRSSSELDTNSLEIGISNSPLKLNQSGAAENEAPSLPLPVLALDVSDVVKENEQSRSGPIWRLAVLALCIVWSSQFAVIEQIFQLAPWLHASTYAAIRFSIAAVVLLPTYYKRLGEKDLVRGSFYIGASVFVAFVGQSMGLSGGTSAGKSAFIAGMTVIWVPLLQGCMRGSFKEQKWASVILAIVGIAFLELEGGAPPTMADAWSLLQPVGFGTSIVLIENLTKTLTYGDDTMCIAGVRTMWVSCLCWVWAYTDGQTMTDAVRALEEPVVLRNLLYLGVFTTAGGWFMQTLCQAKVKAQDFALILSSEPIFATLFAILMLDAQVTSQDIVGGLLVVVACLSNEFNISFDASRVSEKPKVVDV
jgi:drug/metabolite transporter (DMT)-like permease